MRVGYLSERILQTLQYYITDSKMSEDINVETRGALLRRHRMSATVCGGVQTGPVPDALRVSVRGSVASAAPDSRGQSGDLSEGSVAPYEEMVSVSLKRRGPLNENRARVQVATNSGSLADYLVSRLLADTGRNSS